MPAAARSIAAAALHRAGEVDVVDLARADQLLGVGVVEHEVLEQPLGQPGRLGNASAKRSPTSSVCEACLRITALPAISAGTIELIAVRYG